MFRVVSIVGSHFDGCSGTCKAALIMVGKEISVWGGLKCKSFAGLMLGKRATLGGLNLKNYLGVHLILHEKTFMVGG